MHGLKFKNVLKKRTNDHTNKVQKKKKRSTPQVLPEMLHRELKLKEQKYEDIPKKRGLPCKRWWNLPHTGTWKSKHTPGRCDQEDCVCALHCLWQPVTSNSCQELGRTPTRALQIARSGGDGGFWGSRQCSNVCSVPAASFHARTSWVAKSCAGRSVKFAMSHPAHSNLGCSAWHPAQLR